MAAVHPAATAAAPYSNEMPSFFFNFFQSLSQYPDAHPYVEKTAQGLCRMYAHREEISEIPDEMKRNNYIWEVTGLMPEPGLCVGRTKEELLKNILAKVELLRATFILSHQNDQLPHFFRSAFRSDPCFNGRMIRLEEYAASAILGLKPVELEEQVDPEVALKFFRALNEMQRLTPSDDEAPPSQEAFVTYLKSRPDYAENFSEEVESKSFRTLFKHICEAL
jgi:hypothetical protein